MNAKQITFDIRYSGDNDAGIRAYTDTVTMTIESENPGGEANVFEQYMLECLSEWFDSASVKQRHAAILEKTTNKNQSLHELHYFTFNYRDIKNQLESLVNEMLRPGCVVRVDNPRFHGQGVVVHRDGCPSDKLAVLLESGNVWWYELETIVGIVPITEFEPWVERHLNPK